MARRDERKVTAAAQGLLGDAGNRRALLAAVSALVRLRRYEHLRLAQALHRVRGASLPALLPPAPGGAPAAP
jgi:hypothetical protein